ncbi:MAG: nucleotide exchange factor GrpE [Bdellovibrionales bacterium]|nr:nucleotide exchange factor GrpE [Bdellovibrionales bacterium]
MSDIHDDDEIEIVGEESSSSDDTLDNRDDNTITTTLEDIEKYKKDYLYLAAEFDNYKKNAIKERSQLVKYGNERLIREVLEVIDNFERALGVAPNADNFESYSKGMQMIHAELLSLLAKFGVSTSNPQGLPFDPNEHEALSSEETAEVGAGHVFRVFKKAYRLHDKLIRPAQVVVAKEPAAGSEDETMGPGDGGN